MTKYFVATIGATFIFCGGNLVCFLAISYLLAKIPNLTPLIVMASYSLGFIFSIFAAITSFRGSLKVKPKQPKARPPETPCPNCGESVVQSEKKCPICGSLLAENSQTADQSS